MSKRQLRILAAMILLSIFVVGGMPLANTAAESLGSAGNGSIDRVATSTSTITPAADSVATQTATSTATQAVTSTATQAVTSTATQAVTATATQAATQAVTQVATLAATVAQVPVAACGDGKYQARLTADTLLFFSRSDSAATSVIIPAGKTVTVIEDSINGFVQIQWACQTYFIKTGSLTVNPDTITKPFPNVAN